MALPPEAQSRSMLQASFHNSVPQGRYTAPMKWPWDTNGPIMSQPPGAHDRMGRLFRGSILGLPALTSALRHGNMRSQILYPRD